MSHASPTCVMLISVISIHSRPIFDVSDVDTVDGRFIWSGLLLKFIVGNFLGSFLSLTQLMSLDPIYISDVPVLSPWLSMPISEYGYLMPGTFPVTANALFSGPILSRSPSVLL